MWRDNDEKLFISETTRFIDEKLVGDFWPYNLNLGMMPIQTLALWYSDKNKLDE